MRRAQAAARFAVGILIAVEMGRVLRDLAELAEWVVAPLAATVDCGLGTACPICYPHVHPTEGNPDD